MEELRRARRLTKQSEEDRERRANMLQKWRNRGEQDSLKVMRRIKRGGQSLLGTEESKTKYARAASALNKYYMACL